MMARLNNTWLGQRWSGLEASEQRLLKIAAPLVALMLGYLLLWQPLQTWRENSANNQQQQVQDLQRLEALSGRLVPVVFLEERQWLALAASTGLRQVKLVEEGDLRKISAEVVSPAMVERFLNAAAEKGWHWQTLNLQGAPIQLEVELRPL